MSQVHIDHARAREILRAAIQHAKDIGYVPSHPKRQDISDVMLGTHLTYRYVLITNLLAKATNPKANALALQAGAELIGAFDSRSLCHNVVVDFDRDAEQLAGKLGRSNEPYLNKPARYQELAATNAVRGGNDRNLQLKCIDILGGLTSHADALSALQDAVYYTMQRRSLVAEAVPLEGEATLHEAITTFAATLVERSNEGESCAIITALAFFLLLRSDGRAHEVRVHPVNQAGSSSRETLDIDVYLHNEGLIHTAEVKDKTFNFNDVDHAATKVRAAGLDRFFFICGPRSGGAATGRAFVSRIAAKGIKACFVDVEQFLAVALGFAPKGLEPRDVWKFIDSRMTAARMKDETIAYVIECAGRAGLVSEGE